MTSQPAPSPQPPQQPANRSGGPRRTTRGWFVAAAAVAVLGLVVTGVLVVLAVPRAPSAPQVVRNAEPVDLDSDGLTIYTSGARVPATATCRVTDERGAAVPLEPQRDGVRETVNTGDTVWSVAFRSTTVVPPGSYGVECSGFLPATVYAVGPRGSLSTFVGLVIGALAALLLSALLTITLLVVGVVKRRATA